jgi:hypothetical protein
MRRAGLYAAGIESVPLHTKKLQISGRFGAYPRDEIVVYSTGVSSSGSSSKPRFWPRILPYYGQGRVRTDAR